MWIATNSYIRRGNIRPKMETGVTSIHYLSRILFYCLSKCTFLASAYPGMMYILSFLHTMILFQALTPTTFSSCCTITGLVPAALITICSKVTPQLARHLWKSLQSTHSVGSQSYNKCPLLSPSNYLVVQVSKSPHNADVQSLPRQNSQRTPSIGYQIVGLAFPSYCRHMSHPNQICSFCTYLDMNLRLCLCYGFDSKETDNFNVPDKKRKGGLGKYDNLGFLCTLERETVMLCLVVLYILRV
jgi:hypothetical protein